MAKKFYAGIGSRETPQDVLESMQYIAQKLGEGGYMLKRYYVDFQLHCHIPIYYGICVIIPS